MKHLIVNDDCISGITGLTDEEPTDYLDSYIKLTDREYEEYLPVIKDYLRILGEVRKEKKIYSLGLTDQ